MVMIVEKLVELMSCRRNRSTLMKPAPVPLYPPQIPHDLNQNRKRAAAVGSRQSCSACWVPSRAMGNQAMGGYKDVFSGRCAEVGGQNRGPKSRPSQDILTKFRPTISLVLRVTSNTSNTRAPLAIIFDATHALLLKHH
jgi:hypothetical protein